MCLSDPEVIIAAGFLLRTTPYAVNLMKNDTSYYLLGVSVISQVLPFSAVVDTQYIIML